MGRKCFAIALAMCLILSLSFGQTKSDSVQVKPHKFSVYAGMGLSVINNSSFVSYLKNVLPYTNSDSIKNFSSGFEFYGGVDYEASRHVALRLEYGYYLRSFSYTSSVYYYNYDISIHQPYLLAYYLIKKKSYEFKIGGGAGFQLASVSTSGVSYKASGVSFRGEVMFSPYLSRYIQANLSGFIIGTFTGSLKDSNGNLLNSANSTQPVNMSGFGAGVRIGFSVLI